MHANSFRTDLLPVQDGRCRNRLILPPDWFCFLLTVLLPSLLTLTRTAVCFLQRLLNILIQEC